MTDKRLTMREAIARYVHDGMSVAIEGFTACICFAAGHEIIRQRRRDLTLIRMTPDLIYDQMIAAGVASRLIFSYLGNPGVGSLNAIRRAVEQGVPQPLELEEYSHYGMVGRYIAGATRLPFYPLRSYLGSDMARANPRIKIIEDPYGGGPIAVVPPLNPDVAIIHAQRADIHGNTQLWGPDRHAEGGSLRRKDAHRCGGGDRGRGGDPRRPEPHAHPRLDRGRRGPRALRRPPLLRPGLLRPRQPVLPGLGADLGPGTRARWPG